MDQMHRMFTPEVLVVPLGSTVSFPNSDSVSHQIYSFSPAKRFQLPLYRGKPYPPVLFDRVGVVILGCNIHDWMIGYIDVTDAPFYGTTDAATHEAPAAGADGRGVVFMGRILMRAGVAQWTIVASALLAASAAHGAAWELDLDVRAVTSDASTSVINGRRGGPRSRRAAPRANGRSGPVTYSCRSGSAATC